MSGGGKGGSQSSSVEIPDWLNSAAEAAVGQGQRIGQIGYVPYAGPDVAAMTPLQGRAMQNTSDAAAAFGMQSGGVNGLPGAETFANGVRGYSSRPLFSEAKQWLATARPGQFQYMNDFFINPQTGEAGQYAAENTSPILNPQEAPENALGLPTWEGYEQGPFTLGHLNKNGPGDGGQARGDASGFGGSGFGGLGGGSFGGYSGVGDMFDGGGPGRSGDKFEGGGAVSAAGNAIGGLL